MPNNSNNETIPVLKSTSRHSTEFLYLITTTCSHCALILSLIPFEGIWETVRPTLKQMHETTRRLRIRALRPTVYSSQAAEVRSARGSEIEVSVCGRRRVALPGPQLLRREVGFVLGLLPAS